jgi:hypothetical protein
MHRFLFPFRCTNQALSNVCPATRDFATLGNPRGHIGVTSAIGCSSRAAIAMPGSFRDRRSEEVRHEGRGLMGIGGVGFPKLGTHPLLLHAELEPEYEKDKD